MNWDEFESYVTGLNHKHKNDRHDVDEIEIKYLGKDEEEPYLLEFVRFKDDWDIVFRVSATGKTILDAAELLRDLVEVYKNRLPSGVKGLLPPKPRGKAGLKRVK
jgi:hypothetical protein